MGVEEDGTRNYSGFDSTSKTVSSSHAPVAVLITNHLKQMVGRCGLIVEHSFILLLPNHP